MDDRVRFVICAVGILVCYFYFGLTQEDISSHKYVMPDGRVDRFTLTLSLVLFQCFVNAAFAALIRYIFERPRPGSNGESVPSMSMQYAVLAVSYLGAMLCSNRALLHCSYPTQVIGKSIKPVPVLVFGVLFAHKRYPLLKFLFIVMISVGVGLFMYSGKHSGKESDFLEGWFPFFGEFLLLVSLGLDGVTGTVQELLRSNQKPSGISMMFFTNAWATLYLLIGFVAGGEIWTFIDFATRHPIIWWKLMSFSVASALGQYFIFMMISHFGPLLCSVVTTTRKFFTVLGSVLIFGHPLGWHQWVGVVFVFAGLLLDSRYGAEKKSLSASNGGGSAEKLK